MPMTCLLIYEYQKKSVIHIAVARLNAQGTADRASRSSWIPPRSASHPAIRFIPSSSARTSRRIMVFKINSHDPKNFLFTTFLYD
jgi:hypothetical protein